MPEQTLLPSLRVADLSTSHLTPADRQLINDGGALGVSMFGEYGSLVYLSADDEMEDRREFGFSAEFVALLLLARGQGFTHIHFDTDAPVVAGLPVFD